MKKFLQTTVALLNVISTPVASKPLDLAVEGFRNSNKAVQAAFYHDNCFHREMFKQTPHEARKRLKKENRASYDSLEKLLGDAYKSTNMTDGELEGMNDDFCEDTARR